MILTLLPRIMGEDKRATSRAEVRWMTQALWGSAGLLRLLLTIRQGFQTAPDCTCLQVTQTTERNCEWGGTPAGWNTTLAQTAAAWFSDWNEPCICEQRSDLLWLQRKGEGSRSLPSASARHCWCGLPTSHVAALCLRKSWQEPTLSARSWWYEFTCFMSL